MYRQEVMLHALTREPELYQEFRQALKSHNEMHPSSPFSSKFEEIDKKMEAKYGQRLSRILAQTQIEAGENDDDLPEDE